MGHEEFGLFYASINFSGFRFTETVFGAVTEEKIYHCEPHEKAKSVFRPNRIYFELFLSKQNKRLDYGLLVPTHSHLAALVGLFLV
jgi:hypothetical protein